MSRQFSIPTVLRMVPNHLLREYFARALPESLPIDWDRIGNREIGPMLKEIDQLPPPQRDTVEQAFRAIFDLSCTTGIDAIFEAASHSGDLDLPETMPCDAGHYAKAMWTWLHRPEAFEKAAMIHQVAGLSWWRKRNDLPALSPDTKGSTMELFACEISGLLQREQGRGQACTVEHFCRTDGTHYFFAYPDDFVASLATHDQDGLLNAQAVRPTFEIVFAFQPDSGSLELCARVAPRLKSQLESVFSRVLLGNELDVWIPSSAYELNQLLDPSFLLSTDPEDQLRVTVTRLRLTYKDNLDRVTVDLGDRDRSMHEAVSHRLHLEGASLDEVDVSMATFCFEFLSTDCRRPGSLTFDVVWPDRCTLRNQRPDRVEVAQKYLRKWNINVGEDLVDNFEAIGV